MATDAHFQSKSGWGKQLTAVIVVAWLILATAGLGWVLAYETRAGSASLSPSHWPADSRIVANQHGATLLLFAHPQCPCTRASLDELEKIVARHQTQVKTCVVFSRSAEAPEDWEQSALCRKAAGIPGVTVFQDVGNREAAQFHAQTSGQTMLYDRDGKLLFSGGITSGRGHAGDNPGSEEIEYCLDHGTTSSRSTPVFGCSIVETSQPPL